MYSNSCSTLHGTGKAEEKSGNLLQSEKATKYTDGDVTHHASSIEDAVSHLVTRDLKEILTIKKQTRWQERLQDLRRRSLIL